MQSSECVKVVLGFSPFFDELLEEVKDEELVELKKVLPSLEPDASEQWKAAETRRIAKNRIFIVKFNQIN